MCRQLDSKLATDLYLTSKSAYESGIDALLDQLQAKHRERLRVVMEDARGLLSNGRQGAMVFVQDELVRQRTEITKEMNKEFSVERNELRSALDLAEERNERFRRDIEELKDELATQKRDVGVLRKELGMASAWRTKFENLEEKHALTLKQEQAKHVVMMKIAKLEDQMKSECGRRDMEIGRQRREIQGLEESLKDLRTDVNVAHIRNDSKKQAKKKGHRK